MTKDDILKQFDTFTLREYGDDWNVKGGVQIKPSEVKQFISDALDQYAEQIRHEAYEKGYQAARNRYRKRYELFSETQEKK